MGIVTDANHQQMGEHCWRTTLDKLSGTSEIKKLGNFLDCGLGVGRKGSEMAGSNKEGKNPQIYDGRGTVKRSMPPAMSGLGPINTG
jgi:hypothetical protein